MPHNTATPLISVIMAARNEAAYIGQAIDSVLKQSYPNFELLVVDDGSTDDTVAIVSKYLMVDNRVRLLRGNACGPAAARQLAVGCSTGHYILIMDADDIVPDNRIEALLSLARGHENVMIGSNVRLMRMDEKFVGELVYPISNEKIRAGFNRLWNRSVMMPGSILATADLYRRFPYNRNFKYLEDWDFVLRVSSDESVYFANSSEFLYFYRLKPNSVSMNWRKRNQYNALLIENQMRRRNGAMPFESLEELYAHIRCNPFAGARFFLIVIAKFFQHNLWRIRMKRMLGFK